MKHEPYLLSPEYKDLKRENILFNFEIYVIYLKMTQIITDGYDYSIKNVTLKMYFI